jgi:hypothetical protein
MESVVKIVLSVDPLCKLEIETEPGEQLPPIIAAAIGDRHFRLDVLGEAPVPLNPGPVYRAGAGDPWPVDDPTVLDLRTAADFEQCEPGAQAVS